MIPFVVLLLLFPAAVLAQPPEVEWSRTHGGSGEDVWLEVLQLGNGGYVCAGGTDRVETGNQWDWWLSELNPEGNDIWQQTYGTAGIDICLSLTQAHFGGYVLCGYGDGFLNSAMTIFTASNGDSMNSHVFSTGWLNGFTKVIRTTDGGYALAGFKRTAGADRDFWLVKLDANGDSVWSRTFGGADDEWCGSVIRTSDGGYLLAGETSSFGSGHYDLWLVRTDSLGNELWSRAYGGPLGDRGSRGLLETSDGGFLAAGHSSFTNDNARDFLLLRVNADGDSLWTHTYDSGENDWCNAMCAATGGGYLLAGTHSIGDINPHTSAWVVRVADNGDSLWSISFSGYTSAGINSVNQTSDGGYIATGYMNSESDTQGDGWAMKLGPDPTVNIGSHSAAQATQFSLLQNYPNPFNASTTIQFNLAAAGRAQVKIYDLAGRVVELIADKFMPQGTHSITYNAGALASGSYFVRLVAGDAAATKKIVLVR